MPKIEQKDGPIQLWDHWLQNLSHAAGINDQVVLKLETLQLASQNRAFLARQIIRLADLMRKAVVGDAMVFYKLDSPSEKLNQQSSLSPRFSSLSRRQTNSCLTNPHFKAALKERTGDERIRLKRPISRASSLGPIQQLEKFSLDQDLTIILLLGTGLSKSNQLFLDLVRTTLRNRQLRQSLATALSSETDRLSTLTHQLSEGLTILDHNLKVRLWNRPLQRLTGFSPPEVENRSYANALVLPNNRDWLEQLLKEYQSNSSLSVFHDELEIQTKQKVRKWVNVSGSFLRDNDGVIFQTILLISDISHHKELENRKNEFISIATHELRTPITVIKGYLSLLQKTAAILPSKQQEYLDRALEANERLIKLSEDLLQVAHVEENRIQFSLRPVNLLTIVRRAVVDLQTKAAAKGLTLDLFAPNFPAIVAADPERLEQVFINLVDNAIKYTAKGSITVAFRQSDDPLTKERQTTVSITDTGLGLNEKEIETIFEKFHRTDGARLSNEPGTGLGLFIVKSFVEKQGGTITVKSRPGRGSSFSVTFASVEAQAIGRKKA